MTKGTIVQLSSNDSRSCVIVHDDECPDTIYLDINYSFQSEEDYWFYAQRPFTAVGYDDSVSVVSSIFEGEI